MLISSRRSFLRTAVAIPFATWLKTRGAFTAPRVRYEARTPQGISMLRVYAKAVKLMKETPDGMTRSWVFQWYSHFVNGDTNKAAELARIYGNPNDPNRAAADAMWDMCQAHSDGQNEDFFLPWHRCFVFYFEQIIATITGKPDFALPYWNYSTADTAFRGVIPPQFRMSGDPDFGSLFDEKRNSGVNNGDPIQKAVPGDPLSLSALSQTAYSSDPPVPGFCQDLDFGLHGHVHVLVGGPKNMGDVPYAAQDPVFWLHHANIDRLWASWNAAGHANPSLNQTFTFADGTGKAVVANIADFLDLSKLGYTYDRFEPVPGAVPMVSAKPASAVRESIAVTAANGGIALGLKATRVTLDPVPSVRSVAAKVGQLAPGRKIQLLISGLSANTQPGVLYVLYLDLPENPTQQQLDDHRIGTFSFFGISHSKEHVGASGHAPASAKRERFISFEVTGKIRALGVNNALGAKPTVTVIPGGDPVATAKPVIGKLELVAH